MPQMFLCLLGACRRPRGGGVAGEKLLHFKVVKGFPDLSSASLQRCHDGLELWHQSAPFERKHAPPICRHSVHNHHTLILTCSILLCDLHSLKSRDMLTCVFNWSPKRIPAVLIGDQTEHKKSEHEQHRHQRSLPLRAPTLAKPHSSHTQCGRVAASPRQEAIAFPLDASPRTLAAPAQAIDKPRQSSSLVLVAYHFPAREINR